MIPLLTAKPFQSALSKVLNTGNKHLYKKPMQRWKDITYTARVIENPLEKRSKEKWMPENMRDKEVRLDFRWGYAVSFKSWASPFLILWLQFQSHDFFPTKKTYIEHHAQFHTEYLVNQGWENMERKMEQERVNGRWERKKRWHKSLMLVLFLFQPLLSLLKVRKTKGQIYCRE